MLLNTSVDCSNFVEFKISDLKKHANDATSERDTVIYSSSENSITSFDKKMYYNSHFKYLFFINDKRIEYADITFKFCSFTKLSLTNITFVNCRFVGCFFDECTIGTHDFRIEFVNCKFSGQAGVSKQIAGIIMAVNMNVVFNNCEMHIVMKEVDLSEAIFKNCRILNTIFELSICKRMIIYGNKLVNFKIDGCNLHDFIISNSDIVNVSIDDIVGKTKCNFETQLIGIEVSKDIINRKEKHVSKLYRQFSHMFKENDYEEISGEYFYLAKKYEIKEEINLMRRVKLHILDYLCGFGERPFNAFFTSVAFIIFFGVLYYFLGFYMNGRVINYDFKIDIKGFTINNIKDLFNAIHFSMVTFTTVGYGNAIPLGMSKIINMFEMFIGVIMVAVFTSTLVRKMIR